MIIDGHAHMGGEYRDLPAILSTLDNLGIDQVILCPADSSRSKSLPLPDISPAFSGKELNFAVNRLLRGITSAKPYQSNIEGGNESVFTVSRSSGGRVIQFFWANPLKEGIIEELKTKIEKWQFRGIKLHQACHPFSIKSSLFRNIAELAVTRNIPVFIHLYSKKEVLDFITVASEYSTVFITGHLIGLELFIQDREKVGENIYFDISCPSLISADRIQKAVKIFGAGRIIMGSDTPYGKNNISEIISRVRSLKLKDQEIEMILGNNMKGILN